MAEERRETPGIDGDDPAPERALLRGAPWILAALALLAWAGAIARGGFAYDDREVLFENPVVEGDLPWSSVVDRDYWHHRGDAGHWRPAATALLRLDRGLWGANARGYHATNVLLHALVVALAAATLRRLCDPRGAPLPWFGLAIFAAHPLLADSVAWISGRTSMASALGGVIGAWLAVRARRPSLVGVATTLGVGLALCGKEDGLAFAVALPLMAAASASSTRDALRRSLVSALGAATAIALWLLAREAALGVALPTSPHAPLAGEPLATRLAIAVAAWGEGLAATLVPLLPLPPNLTVDDVSGASLPGRVALFGVLAFCAAFAGWRGYRRAAPGPEAAWRLRLVEGSLLCVAAAVAPLLQIVPSGELFAPRFLYLPLLFGAPAMSALLRVVVPNTGPRRAFATLCLVTCIALAWSAAGRYASRAAYWNAHLPRHAEDARVWNALGNAAREENALDDARRFWRRATEIDADYSRPWVNLATLAIESGEHGEAEELLRQALVAGPENATAWANLGVLLLRDGRPTEAVGVYRRAITLTPGRAALHRGLARALRRTGDLSGAREAAERALELAPKDAATRRLLESL